jgi:deoxyribonuclease V
MDGRTIHHLHAWDVTLPEAVALQQRLRQQVRVEPFPGPVRRVAGVDVSFRGEKARAAVAVLSFPSLQLVEQAWAEVTISFPYIPGYLSFREGPAVLAAFARLTLWPDLVIFDGQGIAHPRRLGLASHLGLFLDLPSIGCAKSRLCGQHDEPGPARGDWTPLCDGGELVGAVLRSRPGTHPLYVSVGHRTDLETAIRYVLGCCTRYRLPETTRWAHRLSGGG